MKALILNSGLGRRMGVMTSEHPKCMTEIKGKETILSRQLKLIEASGIKEVVITTGYFDKVLVEYCNSLKLNINYTFIKNPIYDTTNYIYSIFCARECLMDDDIVMMHGDLVFEEKVFTDVLNSEKSCMTVSSTLQLPEKDFKAVVHNGHIEKIGIEFFDMAMAAQPLYKLKREDWLVWLNKIADFCEKNNIKCYAENAFNEISNECNIYVLDVKEALCSEIDTPDDYRVVCEKLCEVEN